MTANSKHHLIYFRSAASHAVVRLDSLSLEVYRSGSPVDTTVINSKENILFLEDVELKNFVTIVAAALSNFVPFLSTCSNDPFRIHLLLVLSRKTS